MALHSLPCPVFRDVVAATAIAALSFSVADGQTARSADQVVPGVVLPATASVVVVDNSVKPVATALHATEIQTNMHAGGNFARAMVYANQHHGVEIPGAHATVLVQSKDLVLYVHLPEVEPELTRARISLLRLHAGKESREVMQFSNNVFNGGHKRTQDEIAITKEDSEGGRWVKVTPQNPLEAGEYAVTQLPKDKLMLPDTVYAFSVTTSK